MLRKVIIIFIISYPLNIFSQVNDTIKYIHNIPCTRIEEKESTEKKDSFYISQITKEDTVEFYFTNNTNSSIYLFSSYYKSEFLTNSYLNRINRKDNIIKISFLPLLPSIILSDRVYVGEEKVLFYNQILYEFIEIKPHCYYKTSINTKVIIDTIEKRSSLVKDFNVSSFKQGYKIRKVKKDKIKKECRILFEFAYYTNLDFIFKKDYQELGSFMRNKSAFKVVDIYWKTIKIHS